MKWRCWHMAFRHAFTNRMYLFINMLGLVIGFTSVFLIGLYLNDEFHYDRFHQDSDKIYRVIQFGNYGGIVERSSSCPFPLGPALDRYFGSSIESYTRLYNYLAPSIKISNRNFVKHDSGFFYADSGFFDVFTVDTIESAQNNWLTEPFTAIITARAARRYFGHTSVTGKKLTVEDRFEVTITGVVKQWPVHSHFRFSVLVSMETLKNMKGGKLPESWVGNPCWTYIKTNENTDHSIIQKQLPNFVHANYDDFIRENNALFLQPLHDIHLTSNLEYEISKNGNMSYIFLFAGIALFLIIMAAINYINLTTATFASRAREIAIKKVLGASVLSVRIQLVAEALLIIFTATIIALVCTELLLPWFNQIVQKDFSLIDIATWRNILILLSVMLLITLAGGLYPAYFIAGLQPASVLRDDMRSAGKSGISRKILVVTQLFISLLLIFAALTIHDQYRYLNRASNGIKRDNLIVVPARFSGLYQHYATFKSKLEADDIITAVSASDYIPGIGHNRHGFFIKGSDTLNDIVFLPALRVMHDFLDTYGMQVTSGRGFNSDSAEASSAVIINREMAEYLGFNNPEKAIGTPVNVYYGNERVVGIMGKFYPQTLHNEPNPFIIDLVADKENADFAKQYVGIRHRDGQQAQALKLVKNYLGRLIDDHSLQVQTYKQIYAAQYHEEKTFSQLAGIMAILSVIISAAGLLGLISFMILQRSKEVSIRKVYGASNKAVLRFMAKEFAYIYVIVILFALPVAWYMSNLWLNTFAAHVGFSVLNWIIAALSVAFMIIIVVALRLQAASRINPAQELNYE